MLKEFAVAMALVAAVPAFAQSNDQTVVAERGDQKLTVAGLRGALAVLDPEARQKLLADPVALAGFARDRVIGEAILDEAKSVKFDQKPEIKARLDEARDSALVTNFLASLTQADPKWPSAAEVDAAYEANKSHMQLPAQYHLADIAIVLPPGATAAQDAEALHRAQDARRKATQPNADFVAVASGLTELTGPAKGHGDIGWLREDALQPPVHAAVAKLAQGGVSEPIRTTDSYHVVKLLGTRPAGPAPEDDVRAQLVQAMRQQRAQALSRSYIEGLLKKQPVVVNDAVLAGAAK